MRWLAIFCAIGAIALSACDATPDATEPNPTLPPPTETTAPTTTTILATDVLDPTPVEIPAFQNVAYWTQTMTGNEDSLLVACDSFVTPVETDIPRTSDPTENIRTSLNELFTADTEFNNWFGQGLNVEDVRIDIDGRAEITISGDMMLVGTCADGVMQAQVLLSVFAEPEVQTAFIAVGGRNMVQVFDMSGLKPDDAVFTRDDIPFVQ